MICSEVAGVKRVLFKIILPVIGIVIWMLTCYPICNKADGFDLFLYWIMVGCPFGIHRMCLWLVPRNFGISGSIGILALNCIIGGLIGGIVVVVKIVRIVGEFVSIVMEHFWTKKSKSGNRKRWILITKCYILFFFVMLFEGKIYHDII